MLDRTGKRGRWQAARASETAYNTRLRGVARAISDIIKGYVNPTDALSNIDLHLIHAALAKYADLIKPWARTVARSMLADVARRNDQQWFANSKEMGRALRAELTQAPTGMILAALQDDQVELITSLPLKASQRVHELTQQALVDSRRASDIAKDILQTGKVTEARARLIARTEVSRAQSNLTQSRAMFAGSQGYIWRTSKDGDVRDTHRAMEGVYVPWDKPPKTDKNLDPYHAGCGPNCRCWAEPVLPDL
jgi:SPP1 gp7 family putative phage head morphogenesis protein